MFDTQGKKKEPTQYIKEREKRKKKGLHTSLYGDL
jgi:hypothetical protein